MRQQWDEQDKERARELGLTSVYDWKQQWDDIEGLPTIEEMSGYLKDWNMPSRRSRLWQFAKTVGYWLAVVVSAAFIGAIVFYALLTG